MNPGVSLEQAPPLAVPLSFFLVAPVALVGAGVALLLGGDSVLASAWMPQVAGVLHIGTLGLLGTVMLGALYQMVPVVAGARVPAVRLAHLVHLLFLPGVVALVWGLWTGRTEVMVPGAGALALALLLFLGPVAAALASAPAKGPTQTGMRLAVAALVVVGLLGVTMVAGRAAGWPLDRRAWLVAHVAAGLVGWVGGLLTSVSWQVVPMFYLTPPSPAPLARLVLSAVALTTVTAALAPAVGFDPTPAAIPGALAVWLLHPIVTLRGLAARKRRRPDASVRAWQAGLLQGPATLAAGTLALWHPDPRWPQLFGWLAVWGWAGLVLHGMLTRIVPFLVWFHRFSDAVGQPGVPSMRKLLPDARARPGLRLHGAAVLLGAAAIALHEPLLLKVTGAALVGAGLALGHALVRVVSFRRSASSSR